MPAHVVATVPYPWPYDGAFDVERVALVVCGAQQRFADAAAGAAAVGDRLADVAAAVRRGGGRVVWVRHGRRHDGGRPAFLPVRGDAGWSLAWPVDAADEIVDTAGWDGCYSSELDGVLRGAGIRSVVLGGLASELTVDSTVRTLNDRGHECLVLTDGCAPLDADLGRRAHCSLTMSGGIFGALGTVEDLMAAIDATAASNAPTTSTTITRSSS